MKVKIELIGICIIYITRKWNVWPSVTTAALLFSHFLCHSHVSHFLQIGQFHPISLADSANKSGDTWDLVLERLGPKHRRKFYMVFLQHPLSVLSSEFPILPVGNSEECNIRHHLPWGNISMLTPQHK